MKYVFSNIKSFILKEKLIFGLMVLCTFCSAIIINFGFGFYHQLRQEKEDLIHGTKGFRIVFSSSYYQDAEEIKALSPVKKGELVDLILGLDESLAKNCTYNLYLRYSEDKTDNEVIDNTLLLESAMFTVKNGKITIGPEAKALEKNSIKCGNYFSKEQMENGEYVCLGYDDGRSFSDDEQEKWRLHYQPDSEGYYTVNGKKYLGIGAGEFLGVVPIVPITTIDDDVEVKEMCVQYYNRGIVSRAQYNDICKAIRDRYGDAPIIEEIQVNDIDAEHFLSIMIFMIIALALLSAIVLALLYKYIIVSRRNKLNIYRLCGMARGEIVSICFIEISLLTGIIYVISTMIYYYNVVPVLKESFQYIDRTAKLSIAGKLGMLYGLVVLFVLLVLIISMTRKSISDEIRGI